MRRAVRKPNPGWMALGAATLLLATVPARGQGPASPTASERPEAAVGGLAERVRAAEAMHEALVERLERSRRANDEQMRLLMQRVEDFSARLPDPAASPAPATNAPSSVEPQTTGPIPEYEARLSEPAPFHTPAPGLSTIASPSLLPLEVKFGPGFQLQTKDEEFQLRFNLESQIEARVWGQASVATPFKSGFFFPRQRIFFRGNATRPIEYVFSLDYSLGAFDILDAYVNLRADDRFQLKFGHYFTPLTYDQYVTSNLWLPTPERSTFTTNLGTGRQIGFMAHGKLLDERLDYAVGLFTGVRSVFADRNDSKDVGGFLNGRPFEKSERLTFLKNWNVGASVDYGTQDQPAVPITFSVAAAESLDTAQTVQAQPSFLSLVPDARERGARLLGGVHSAYFFKGLSVLGEWNYGHAGYASPALGTSADVPFSAWYVAGGYFLTGEHVDRRAMLRPRRPLFPTRPDQRRGLGAWELAGRVSQLNFGREFFEAGLADPNRWTDSATTYELGVNWYWNEHLKVYAFWLHADFDRPVFYVPGAGLSDVDMFWMRFQLYY